MQNHPKLESEGYKNVNLISNPYLCCITATLRVNMEIDIAACLILYHILE